MLVDRTRRIQPVPLLVVVHISKTEVILLVYVQVLVAKVEQILSVVLLLFGREGERSVSADVFQGSLLRISYGNLRAFRKLVSSKEKVNEL